MDDIPKNIPHKPVRFLDQLRLHIRKSGLAYRTEQTYIHWIKRFIYFNNKAHPKDLGVLHIEVFLNDLAVHRHCAINTQKIATGSHVINR